MKGTLFAFDAAGNARSPLLIHTYESNRLIQGNLQCGDQSAVLLIFCNTLQADLPVLCLRTVRPDNLLDSELMCSRGNMTVN